MARKAEGSSGLIERRGTTLSGHCVVAAADVVIRASGHFIGASWSVQFRWMQPLGNELRPGLQLSSNARTAHAERLIASRVARAYGSRSAIWRFGPPRALGKNRIDAEFRNGAAVERSGY